MAKTKEIDQEISELEKQVAFLKEKKERLESPNLIKEYLERKVESKKKVESILDELRTAMKKLHNFCANSKEMVPGVSFDGFTYGSGNTRFAYSFDKIEDEASDLGISAKELEQLLSEHDVDVERNYNGDNGWCSSSTDC